MAHPIGNEHRQHHHEKERVSHLCGGRAGYAAGGKVHADEAADKKFMKKELKASAFKDGGKKPKMRADRPHRAKGGRVKHKGGKTNVNVIVAPSGGPKPAMAGLGPAPMPAPAPAAPPPMVGKPPMPPMGGGTGMPPGMPMRKRGGSVKQHDTKEPTRHHKGGKGAVEAHNKLLPGATTNTLAGPSTDKRGTEKNAAQDAKREVLVRARGGRAAENGGMNGADKQGRTGIGFRLPVQHSGNKDDTQHIGRKKPITYATGGPVYADGRHDHGMGPDMDGAGARGGKARLIKARRAAGHVHV